MLTSSTQLQNRSFHVVEKTRKYSKCQKMKNARAKLAKILFFIVKYANLWGCRRRRGCLSSVLTEARGNIKSGKEMKRRRVSEDGGRHFSPSPPGDRYLKLGSKSDLRTEVSGSIVWYDALAPRPELLH